MSQEPLAIGLYNRSSYIQYNHFVSILSAINRQLQGEFKDAWAVDAFVVSADSDEALSHYSARISIADNIDDPKALGYHTQLPGNVMWGIVGCKPVIDSGGAIILGGDMTIPTVSAVISHEVLELLIDPYCNLWADTGERSEVALEVCDPCEANQYEQKDADGSEVAVSDFVLPSWFNPYGQGATSYTNVTPGPFQIARGGYCIKRAHGEESFVNGHSALPWKAQTERTTLTSLRRTTRLHGRLTA